MEIIKDKAMVYIKDENGNMIAYATFPVNKDGYCVIDHTFVSPLLRGQGVAAKLMEKAYESIKEQGLKCLPTCSYAVTWFDKNEDKKDILL